MFLKRNDSSHRIGCRNIILDVTPMKRPKSQILPLRLHFLSCQETSHPRFYLLSFRLKERSRTSYIHSLLIYLYILYIYIYKQYVLYLPFKLCPSYYFYVTQSEYSTSIRRLYVSSCYSGYFFVDHLNYHRHRVYRTFHFVEHFILTGKQTWIKYLQVE